MDVAQMQQLIQDHGYTTDTSTAQLDFINSAYRKLHSSQRWPFLEAINTTLNTVAGTSSYSFPGAMSNWRNLDAVRLSQPTIQNFVMIEYSDPQTFFDMLQVDQVDTATPRYWTMYAQQLWFYPIPDDIYNVTIYYIQEPPDLVNPTDVPIIPIAFHDAIVAGAICSIAFRERDWIGLELWTAEYQRLTTVLKEEYLLKQRQTSSEVLNSGWWDTHINYPLSSTGF